MIFTAFPSSNLETLKDEFSHFSTITLPDTEIAAFTTLIYRSTESYLAQDYDTSLNHLHLSLNYIQHLVYSENIAITIYLMISHINIEAGNYHQALEAIKQAEIGRAHV